MRSVTDADVAIGLRIREARKTRGLTIQDLANALTVSVQQMAKYESGQNRITAAKLVIISNFLQIDIRSLVGSEFSSSRSAQSPRAEALAQIFDQIADNDVKRAIYTLASNAAKKPLGKIFTTTMGENRDEEALAED